MLSIAPDAPDEVGDAVERATPNGLLGDQTEPALDLVEPGGAGRSEVHVVARPPRQPGAHFGMLLIMYLTQQALEAPAGCRVWPAAAPRPAAGPCRPSGSAG